MSPQESAHSTPARPLYDRVEEIRIARGWSKTQMANAIGRDRGTIENWRTITKPPTVGVLRDVAEALGLDYDELLELVGIRRSTGKPTTAEKLDAAEDRLDALEDELERRLAIATVQEKQVAQEAAQSAQLGVLRALQGDLEQDRN